MGRAIRRCSGAMLAAALVVGCRADAPAASAPASESAAPPVTVDLGSAAASAEPAPIVAPVDVPAARAAHAAAQARLLRDDVPLPPLHPADDPDPASPGVFVPITGGDGLARFHAALDVLEEGKAPGGKVRVLVYGASGTASDRATGYLRTYLQARFGDGGPGFVPLVPLTRWYHHSEVRVTGPTKGWTKQHAQNDHDEGDGRWGLLGASFATSRGKRRARIEPGRGTESAQQIAAAELWFLQQPGGGSFEVRVDGKPAGTVSTAAEEFGPGYHALSIDPGPHTIEIVTAGDGEVRVFGAVLDRTDPGVVVDTLGIDGTRSANQLRWDEALWTEHVRRRAPDLYVLSYGTNEAVDDPEEFPIERYEAELRAVLDRFARALPDASCLMLVPVDFPIETPEGWQPRPRLLEIRDVQLRVADEVGCATWDGMAFMGGPGTMPGWVSCEPPLARDDHLHYTTRGAARKGQALADACMAGRDARP